jgi:MFS transporter, PAT family, beta-lactamase induction signal transducer AmpG
MFNPLIVFMNRRMLIVLLLGFSSGLPLALTGGTLQAWLKTAGVDLPTIGYFALVGLPYALKFLWAPVLDGFMPPILGRRRGWAFLSQLLLTISIIGLGFCDPHTNIPLCALAAFAVVLFSATQDIVVDAFKIEILKKEEYGLGGSVATLGYRLAMLVSGALALWLADTKEGIGMPWKHVYFIMALFMIPGILTILFSAEPKTIFKTPVSFRERFTLPFAEFFRRPAAVQILSFVMVYKLSTMMAVALTTAFLMEKGYTLTEIGPQSKVYVMIASMVGPLCGGVFMMKLGLKRALWIFGIIQALAGLSFLIINSMDHNLPMMITCLVVENFLIGLGVASISAFMMSVCSLQFTGTQFALLSSLTAVPRVILVSQAGALSKWLGWPTFFIFSVFLAIPGLMLLTHFDSWMKPTEARSKIAGIDRIILVLFFGGLLLISSTPIWTLSESLKDFANQFAKAGGFTVAAALVIGFIKPWISTPKRVVR